MHYIIHCLDKPNSVEKRLAHYDAHKAYLSNAPVTIVISGPLVADDEETMIGSCFLIEAGTLESVEAFNQNDPFRKADLWDQISIRPFIKRMDNRN
ncbi:YciI family protein [uncultured Hoeflea sp.]|uniref:YciI family protein n=1 Tax=uncultured Hoeflea sp. TaxID=538666 RepID=UPI0030DB5C15|tara:strand:+ start:53 stop:340 length:288 start_codon:yes stop_codon:yes gene_type:complete